MANYNIQMEYFNGGSYDVLQPQTVLNNITDWSSNLYNKTEVDSKTNSLQSSINSMQGTINSINSIVSGGYLIKRINYGSFRFTSGGQSVNISLRENQLLQYSLLFFQTTCSTGQGWIELQLNNGTIIITSLCDSSKTNINIANFGIAGTTFDYSNLQINWQRGIVFSDDIYYDDIVNSNNTLKVAISSSNFLSVPCAGTYYIYGLSL